MRDGSATAHIYRPKIVTVLAEGYNLGCFRRDMLAALTVAIVALPLSMAIAVASGVSRERGLYAAIIVGFFSIGARRQPLSNRRSGRRVHRSCRGDCHQIRPGRTSTHGFHLRIHADLDRSAATGVAHSLHSACRDRRLHLRDRGHDFCQPAQGAGRPEIDRCRAGIAVAEARHAGSGVADHQPGGASGWRGLGRLDFRTAAPAAELAGNADQRWACFAGRMAVPFACRDHRQPLWRTRAWIAFPSIAIDLVFVGARCVAGRALFHAAWGG